MGGNYQEVKSIDPYVEEGMWPQICLRDCGFGDKKNHHFFLEAVWVHDLAFQVFFFTNCNWTNVSYTTS